jgi:glycosyltransferase involved in cell wall biosynthesis
MKRIVFVTQFLDGTGGVVRVISNWSNYFVKIGYKVETVSIRNNPSYFKLDKKIKYTIYPFRFDKPFLNIIQNTFLMYTFLSERQHANIVFNKSLYIEPIWILRKLGFFKNINLIYFAHGGSSDFKDFYMSRPLVKHRVKMIFEAFDKVVCLYDDEKNYPKEVKKDKLYFMPNPLPFEPTTINLNQKENIVLSLGRVTKEKGIDTLIKAWQKVEDAEQNWKLKIVGDGRDKGDFMVLSKKLGLKNVEFLPSTSDVKHNYENAKIFVIPSLFEGFGMTIIEAMANKCCVISSQTAGGNKLVNHNETGLLFDIGDSEELSNRIIDLIKNKKQREKLSVNAYNYVQQYKIENIAENWDKVLI